MTVETNITQSFESCTLTVVGRNPLYACEVFGSAARKFQFQRTKILLFKRMSLGSMQVYVESWATLRNDRLEHAYGKAYIT